MSQAGYTPIQLYYSTTAAATPSAGNLAAGELAVNITDGKLFYKDNGGVVRVLATAAGSAGDVVGPGSSTDNALVRFDGTTGKLVQNSAGVLDDSGNLTGIAALTTSGALTLNGGTANGVPYLNASKVLTSGSALTFDGSSLVGTGKFQSQVLRIKDASYSELYFSTADNGGNGAISYNHSANAMAFYANGSEQMRLTSTGLGIGTSSMLGVSDRLAVVGGNIAVQRTSGITTILGDNTQRGYVGTISNHTLSFLTNGTEQMYLDSSGNLGLGVTPSAWAAIYKNIDLNTSSSIGATATQLDVGYNFFWNGTNNVYKVSGQNASTYRQRSSGEHIWYTAPSGTAGNAISFTQAMTLDASGNLGVGTTSPSTRLSLGGGIGQKLSVYDFSGTRSGFGVDMGGSSYELSIFSGFNGGNGVITFGGLNTATNTYTERARIDSSGNWCVGRAAQLTGTGATISTDGRSANCTLAIQAHNGAGFDPQIYFEAPGVNAAWVFFNRATSTLRCSVGGQTTGVSLAGGATSWGTFSDERLKDIIEPIKNAAQKVSSIRAVIGRYKTDKPDRRRSFLIAQDVQAVLPEAVYQNSEEDDTLSLAYTDTIPLLVAAIQEQQAIIEDMKTRLAAAGIA